MDKINSIPQNSSDIQTYDDSDIQNQTTNILPSQMGESTEERSMGRTLQSQLSKNVFIVPEGHVAQRWQMSADRSKSKMRYQKQKKIANKTALNFAR